MTESKHKITILLYQYSVVIKGLERSLKDMGYEVEFCTNEFGKVREYAQRTDLFLLYLPRDIVDDYKKIDMLLLLCDMVRDSGREMLVIGDDLFHGALLRRLPAIGRFKWFDRPVDMKALQPTIVAAITNQRKQEAKKTILIVDDDPAYAGMVREWIKDKYKVKIVTAGMKAITVLLKERVDLILLDYEMPVVDGTQVLQMLRQEDETKNIPVVFLTGVRTLEEVRRCMELKPEGYMLKNIGKEEILAMLEEKLGDKSK